MLEIPAVPRQVLVTESSTCSPVLPGHFVGVTIELACVARPQDACLDRQRFERRLRSEIALNVARDLGFPELDIAGRSLSTRAIVSVPKATVDK